MAAEKSTSQFSDSKKDGDKVKVQTADLLKTLDSRRTSYSKLPPEAQVKWRENAKDPVMNEAWKLFLSLAEFFGVEVPR